MSAAVKDKPALLSICLSNEPVYNKSGKTRKTLPLYRQYLKDIHGGDIAKLNALYNTHYKSFDEVSAQPRLVQEVEKNRAFYDWTRFNKKHFSEWHRWMAQIVKKNLPHVPVHAKIMVLYSFDRDKLGWGVDPEEFCDVSDIAGCDAYNLPAGDYKSYDWFGHEFWYDLLNSFHNQPVFNSENHIIADGLGPLHIPATMTRAVLAGRAAPPGGDDDVGVGEGFRHVAGRQHLLPSCQHLRRWPRLHRYRPFCRRGRGHRPAPPRIALLYSQPSIFWEGGYAGAIRDIYTRLNFLGEKATFVSEKMLQERRLPSGLRWIVLPQATHVEEATVAALAEFVARGGKIIRIGDDNLALDQYDRRRKVPSSLLDGPAVRKLDFQKDAAGGQQVLRKILKPVELLDAASGKPTWNVEYRLVDYRGSTLMPLINFAVGPVAVRCPALAGKHVIDLLSGEEVDPRSIKLEPMVPRLLALGDEERAKSRQTGRSTSYVASLEQSVGFKRENQLIDSSPGNNENVEVGIVPKVSIALKVLKESDKRLGEGPVSVTVGIVIELGTVRTLNWRARKQRCDRREDVVERLVKFISCRYGKVVRHAFSP